MKSLLTLLFCSAAIIMMALTCHVDKPITGTVVDGNTQLPIEGAHVFGEHGGEDYTDSNGQFSMTINDDKESSPFNVFVVKDGYTERVYSFSSTNNATIELYP